MANKTTHIPSIIQWLVSFGCIQLENAVMSDDGFYAIINPISSILAYAGIETFPDREGQLLECRNFFDDWFLYVIANGEKEICSLFKMREQENDKNRGITADGDTPGVTISFIAFDEEILKACLENSSAENRRRLGMEINRVVAYVGQAHHPILKNYFIRPESKGAYVIAELYAGHIAYYAVGGELIVPEAYRNIFSRRDTSRKFARIPNFLDENNRNANTIVCDHQKIYLKDPLCLSEYEKYAILATHCGNVSFHSFSAEVRYHAMFLTKLAKIKLPFVGSPYASAVRADMSIGDKEFQGPTPYYNLQSRLVRTQREHHGDAETHYMVNMDNA